MRLTFRPGTTKTEIEIFGDLNEPIGDAFNFSLFPRYTEIDETKHVGPSRSSGFPVMWLVAPLYRVNLSLFAVIGQTFRSFPSLKERYQSKLSAAEGQNFQICSRSSEECVLSQTWSSARTRLFLV
jgi:hypothetical protein